MSEAGRSFGLRTVGVESVWEVRSVGFSGSVLVVLGFERWGCLLVVGGTTSSS